MSPLLCLALLAAPQDPVTGEVGKLAWPPRHATPLHYQAKLVKRRALTPATEKAAAEAMKALELKPVKRQPRQEVVLGMRIQLVGGDSEIRCKYRISIEKQSLRLKLLKPVEGEQPPPLTNLRAGEVWGPPAKGEKPLELPRSAIEREFEMSFRRRSSHEAYPQDFTGRFGDHLLPILWNDPLPCWADELVGVLDMEGEAIIEGKSLIRDRTDALPIGYRDTRVELMFTKASPREFSMKYEMRVKQMVSRLRDYSEPLERHYDWVFEIAGQATYSLSDQAFLEIRESVKARLENAAPEKLAAIHDEEFEGTIEIVRVADPDTSSKKGKRGRRTTRR